MCNSETILSTFVLNVSTKQNNLNSVIKRHCQSILSTFNEMKREMYLIFVENLLLLFPIFNYRDGLV